MGRHLYVESGPRSDYTCYMKWTMWCALLPFSFVLDVAEWITEFWVLRNLSDRRQYVIFNGRSSSTKYIKCGVAQNSVSRPLLFLLPINDYKGYVTIFFPILFADDTNWFNKSTDKRFFEDNLKHLNKDLKYESVWLRLNKLSLNVSKSHYIIFTRKKKAGNVLNIRIENQIIDKVYETKFLVWLLIKFEMQIW